MFRFTFLRLGLIVLATRCVWAFTSPAQSVGVAQGRAAFLHLPTQNVPQSSYRNIRTSFMAITWKDIEKLKSNEASNIEFSEGQESYDSLLFVFAIVPPVLAFLFQDEIAKSVAYFLGYFGFQGKNVDGNAFANNLLRPTINGVVVPATSIVLGTLFATTVNVLWNRQLQLRAYINKEVGELRLLRRALFGCFGTAQHCKRRAAALGLLHSYTRTLIAETEVECLDRLRHIQLNGGISMNELDELADMLHGVDGAAASRQGSVATAGGLLVSLNQHRSERVATTLSVFPRIHWGVLLALFGSINVAFLIESNQEVLQYLNSIQLRVLFSIIIGVGSGASMLLRDLQDPFQGSFCITLTAKQLDSFEELLASDVLEAQAEYQQGGRSALMSLDREYKRTKYNTGNTLYFHLLTGPLAYNVRVIGDVFAWVFRKFSMVWHRIKLRPRWKGRKSSAPH